VRHLRILGVCLVAVFAIAVVAAASASAAEPEFKACTKLKPNKTTKLYEGGYTNSTCTEVNAKKEGKYELEAAKLPISFTGKGKAATFNYYKPGGKIIWKVLCKKNTTSAVISEPTVTEGVTTFGECAATNQITKVKTICAGTIEVPFGASLHGETVPATGNPGNAEAFFAPAYSCGTATFESVTAIPFVVGQVSTTSAGVLSTWTVNKTTGAQSLTQWIEEGKPTKWAPVEVEVTQGASAETLGFGLATVDPIGPKGTVVR
jgi:hypothetical protein